MTAITARTPAPPPPEPIGGRFSISGPTIKCSAPECIILDYETGGIQARPQYPPKPVGVALQFPGERRGKYYSWGHPTSNNGHETEALSALARAWQSGLPILCQHGKFDLDVAETHHGLPALPWERTHDMEYQLFLHDPHAKSLSLKPSAERILGMKPEERDEVRDWILANVPEARRKPSEAMAYICRAPGDLVGRYAISDLTRTLRLHNKLYPEICLRGMRDAYDRERRLMPILLATERVGIRTDYEAMERDLPIFQAARERVGQWLRKRLGDINLDSDKQVGDALAAKDYVTEWEWTRGSADGKRAPQRSTSKKSMTLDRFHDQKVAMAYGYYQRCGTLLSMFLENWLELAGPNSGWLKPNWNSVRSDRNGGLVGTRSGRPSCDNPNFLAIVKKWENSKGDGYTHPKFVANVPELPLARKYLLPDEGGVWLHRDYNQQELRLLGHFEGEKLAASYRVKPYRDENGEMRFDVHTAVQNGIRELTGQSWNRDSMKELNFGPIYGKGIKAMAEKLGVAQEEVRKISVVRDMVLPGVAKLKSSIEAWGKAGKPIVTWGGREYFMEEPKYVEKFNRVMDFAYKLLNYAVQPSAADMTKQAIVDHDAHPKREGRLLTTVYDEINISTPSLKRLSSKGKRDCIAREHAALRESMEYQKCSVPMLSDGKTGPNWADLTKYWTKEEAKEIV
jgi:DNA polymerase I-like protein with 3'-5' exonuclease and polymerase domains